jgi:glycosyltransferase involved in cell wall biosynthesis
MITVIVASFNGSHTLPRCLAALTQLTSPKGGWKLLLVDNASTDATPQIMRSFADKLPTQIIRHGERGKNRALNAALDHVEGDLVVFTDDDTIPDGDWLVALKRTAEGRPERALFGGAIEAEWEAMPAPWIKEAIPIGVTFALTAPGLMEGEIFPGLIWGPNMMVRRTVFDVGHRFAVTVGPGPGNYIMGSESEFNIRMTRHGYRTWYTPAARVRHIIRPHQLQKMWILNRAFRFGRNTWRQSADKQARRTFGAPNWMLRRVTTRALKGAVHVPPFGNEATLMSILWDVFHDCGYVYQAYQDHRARI